MQRGPSIPNLASGLDRFASYPWPVGTDLAHPEARVNPVSFEAPALLRLIDHGLSGRTWKHQVQPPVTEQQSHLSNQEDWDPAWGALEDPVGALSISPVIAKSPPSSGVVPYSTFGALASGCSCNPSQGHPEAPLNHCRVLDAGYALVDVIIHGSPSIIKTAPMRASIHHPPPRATETTVKDRIPCAP